MGSNTIIKHIIIQAGGSGTRMGYLTKNKPKALVSVFGEPLIMNVMRKNPGAHFYISGEYKYDVLSTYLNKFASKYDFQLFKRKSSGSSAAGLQEAVDMVPAGEPLAILWCDLYFGDKFYPDALDFKNKNYIGLSTTFQCRWSYEDGKLKEEPSRECGVAGVFIFKDKTELGRIPNTEFCKHLQSSGLQFEPYNLQDTKEVGTLDAYNELISEAPSARPFNKVKILKTSVVKEPINEHGMQLAEREIRWYKTATRLKWQFIPEVLSYKPLRLERIIGDNLFNADLSHSTKEKLLLSLIASLREIHATKKSFPAAQRHSNDQKAIITKTKDRVDSISDIIPFASDQYLYINGKKCLNYYRAWDKLLERYNSYLGGSDYALIHGDPTFSNTIYNRSINKLYLIDPRGYYGDIELYGDPDYDWAKLYYSIVGNYDHFNRKNFVLNFDDNHISLKIKSSGWEKLEDTLLLYTEADPNKIKLMHAIIWLSLTSYTWDDYDSICAAFYKGIELLNT